MNQAENIPHATNKTLIIATLTAVVISALIYFALILPAEYNIDPTGIGKKLGLTVLSEPSTTPVINQKIIEKDTVEDSFEFREDSVFVTIPANKGVEYKFNIKEFGNLTYDWKTNDNLNIYFDFHGEPAGDTTGYFESFTIATTSNMKGSATVPFEGSHGWYWKNTSNQDIIIELKTSGNYQVIGLKK
jgi:hypothetical protein